MGRLPQPERGVLSVANAGWELLLGGFCALYLNKRPPISSYALNQLMSLVGFGLILFAVFAFDKTTPTPSLYTLIPTVGVVLIILFANAGTIVQRVLSLGPIVAIGLVSYSAYLWHQPSLVFYRVFTLEEPSLAWVAILTALTFVLAYLTYVLVEQPFRNKTSWRISRTGIFAGSAAGIVLFATAGVAGHLYQGFPARNPDFLRLQQNFGISARCSGAPIDSAKCKTNSDPKVIIWGDSHAMHLAGALKLIFEKDGLWQTTLSACPPVPGLKEATRNALTDCFDYNEIVQRRLMSIENPSQYTIFMSAAKDLTLPEVRDDFAKSVKALKQRGFKLYVISTTPRFGSVQRCVMAGIRGGEGFDQCRYDFQSAENRDYFKGMQAFAQELGIGCVDLKDLFCDGSQCGVARDGKLLLRDSAHFAVEAAPVLARYLAPRIGYPTGASVSD